MARFNGLTVEELNNNKIGLFMINGTKGKQNIYCKSAIKI